LFVLAGPVVGPQKDPRPRMNNAIFSRQLESVSAGFPSAAEGYEDEPLNLHDFLVRNPAATFFYRVRGDDLTAAEHIRDGSILVVDRSVPATRGRLVLVEAAGAFAVVRCRATDAPVRLCGVVTAVVTRL
jgi:DNA polymerase V